MSKKLLNLYIRSEKIKGYHGTRSSNVASILANNFTASGKDDWCGGGCYFFIDGISEKPAMENAKQWAIDKSYDNALRGNIYNEYSVLEAEIKVSENKLLDLTVSEGKKQFNEYRAMYLEMLRKEGKIVRGKLFDGDIVDLMKEDIGYEIVKADMYIRFAEQRKQKIKSNQPNVTIFAVSNPGKNIRKSAIKECFKGTIS